MKIDEKVIGDWIKAKDSQACILSLWSQTVYLRSSWLWGHFWVWVHWIYEPILGQVYKDELSKTLHKINENRGIFFAHLQDHLPSMDLSSLNLINEFVFRPLTLTYDFYRGEDHFDRKKIKYSIESIQRLIESKISMKIPWKGIESIYFDDEMSRETACLEVDSFLRVLSRYHYILTNHDIWALIYQKILMAYSAYISEEESQIKALISIQKIVAYIEHHFPNHFLCNQDSWHIHYFSYLFHYQEIKKDLMEEDRGVKISFYKKEAEQESELVTFIPLDGMSNLFSGLLRYFQKSKVFDPYFSIHSVLQFGNGYRATAPKWKIGERVFIEHNQWDEALMPSLNSLDHFLSLAIYKKSVPIIQSENYWGYDEDGKLFCLIPPGCKEGASFIELDQLIWKFSKQNSQSSYTLYRHLFSSTKLSHHPHCKEFTRLAIQLLKSESRSFHSMISFKDSESILILGIYHQECVRVVRKLRLEGISRAKDKFIQWLESHDQGYRLPSYRHIRSQIIRY